MKAYSAIRTILYWALAALIVVFVSKLVQIEALRYFIGGLMMLYGAEELLFTVFRSRKHYSVHSLYWNIIEIVIGLILVVFVETGDEEVTYAVVCVSWAIWSILREARELVEATEELKGKNPIISKIVAVASILESLTIVALSLTMLIEPGEHHARIHVYLLAVELFTKALFPVTNYVAELLEKRKKAKAANAETDSLPEEEEAELAASDGKVQAAVSEEVPTKEEGLIADAAEAPTNEKTLTGDEPLTKVEEKV